MEKEIKWLVKEGLTLFPQLGKKCTTVYSPQIYTYWASEVEPLPTHDLCLTACHIWNGKKTRKDGPVTDNGFSIMRLLWLLTRQPEIWPKSMEWHRTRAKHLLTNKAIRTGTYRALMEIYDRQESLGVEGDKVVRACDRHGCINPEHLTLLTPLQMANTDKDKNALSAILPEATVKEIEEFKIATFIAQARKNNTPVRELAKRFSLLPSEVARLQKVGMALMREGRTNDLLKGAVFGKSKLPPGRSVYCDNYIFPVSFPAMLDRIYWSLRSNKEEVPCTHERGLLVPIVLKAMGDKKAATKWLSDIIAIATAEEDGDAYSVGMSPYFNRTTDAVEYHPVGSRYRLEVQAMQGLVEKVKKKFHRELNLIPSTLKKQLGDMYNDIEVEWKKTDEIKLKEAIVKPDLSRILPSERRRALKLSERLLDELDKPEVKVLKRRRRKVNEPPRTRGLAVVTSATDGVPNPKGLVSSKLNKALEIENPGVDEADIGEEIINKELQHVAQRELGQGSASEDEPKSYLHLIVSLPPEIMSHTPTGPYEATPSGVEHVEGTATIPIEDDELAELRKIYAFFDKITPMMNTWWEEACRIQEQHVRRREAREKLGLKFSQLTKKEVEENSSSVNWENFSFSFLPSWGKDLVSSLWSVELDYPEKGMWVARYDMERTDVANLFSSSVEEYFGANYDCLDYMSLEERMRKNLETLRKNLARAESDVDKELEAHSERTA